LPARRFAEDSIGNLYTTDVPRGISRITNRDISLFENRLNLMYMVESSDRNLWFSSRDGVIRIGERDLAESGDSEMPLNCEQIDRADGLLTTEARIGSPNIAITPDGKLWLGTAKGLALIDTARPQEPMIASPAWST
jgi:ligand-binding sensor domain-containing protein